jgi:tetratricopeptide (TPR) repeat protein
MRQSRERQPPNPETQAIFRGRIRLTILCAVLTVAAGAGVAAYFQSAGAPGRAAGEFEKGMRSMTPGRYQEAVQHFSRALEIQPGRSGVHLQRGRAYQHLGRLDAALADFQRASTEDPLQAEVHTALAAIHRARGDRARALEEFAAALRIEESADTYYERAQLHRESGQPKKAIEDLDQVVSRLRDAPHALRLRAMVKREMGDPAGAAADLAVAAAFERRSQEQQKRP